MDKRVYQETPLKVAVRVVAAIIGLILVLILLFTYVIPSRPSTPSEKFGGMVALGLALGVMILTLLIAWLVIRKRVVTVDQIGCEVMAKRPLGKAEVERFEWKDVAGTTVSAHSYRVQNSTQTSYKLSVQVEGRTIYLMDKTFLTANLRSLVAEVNAATRHLGYAWEMCRADETRPVLEAAAPFCKVALDSPAGAPAGGPRPRIAPVGNVVANPARPSAPTRKQLIDDAKGTLVAGAIFAVLAGAFVVFDYREQKRRWEFNSRIPAMDFRTGKTLPKPPPPPMKYVFGDSGAKVPIIIVGAVSVMMLGLGLLSLAKARRVVETAEMREADAKREAIRNTPEAKQARRGAIRTLAITLLAFAPVVVMLYLKAHFAIYFGYIFAAAAVVFVLMLRGSRRK